jgi:CBS domain-containing protein
MSSRFTPIANAVPTLPAAGPHLACGPVLALAVGMSPNRTVEQLMTRKLTTVGPDERLDLALTLMDTCGIAHLPVEERGLLIGVLSLRDLLSADLSRIEAGPGTRARHLRARCVREVMQAPVIVAHPQLPVEQAARLLLLHRISCLPVVDEGRLVGIVTRRDFLREALQALERDGARDRRTVPVAHLMTPRPLAVVRSDDHLDVAHAIMKSERIVHLPVVDGERLVGILSDQDLLACVGSSLVRRSPGERLVEKSAVQVADAMTAPVVAVSPGEDAIAAGEQLLRRRIGALPVMRGNRLVGILSVSDYFYYFMAAALPSGRAWEGLTRAG